MERTTTGIPGLDGLLEGGFPSGRTFLVSGSPGTGKTTLALQYLYKGAMNGEPGVVLSLEEEPRLWREDMEQYGFDLTSLEKSGKLAVIDASLVKLGLESDEKFVLSPEEFDLNHMLINVIRIARKIGAKRAVVDSLPSLDILFENQKDIRSNILKMNYLFKANGLTTLLLSEIEEGSKNYSRYGVEEYITDGVITLHYVSLGAQSGRSLIIRKMRGTKHSEDIHPIEFVEGKGMVVKSVEDSI